MFTLSRRRVVVLVVLTCLLLITLDQRGNAIILQHAHAVADPFRAEVLNRLADILRGSPLPRMDGHV